MQNRIFASALLLSLALGMPAVADNHNTQTRSSGSSDSSIGDYFSSGTKATVTEGQNSQDINAARKEAYDGPKARIAIARFTDKTNSGWWSGSIGDGMADQLATALFNSNRFIVLERQALDDVLYEQDLGASGRIKQETAAQIGEIEGAELLIVGAVTEFEGNAGGTQAGLGGIIGGTFGAILGGITGGVRKAHMAIDVRVIDAKTSRILAATSVEGEATDVNLGGALGGAFGGGALGGSLAGWKNTPIEKALRICTQKAVEFISSKTPPVFYRFGATPAQTVSTQPTQPAQARPPAPRYRMGTVVRVSSRKLNMRSGPNKSNAVVRSLERNTPLLVEEQNGDWIRVKSEGGDNGWIAAWLTYEDPKLSPEIFQGGAQVVPAAATETSGSAPAPVSAAPKDKAGDDPIARLKKLKALFGAELISEEEYNAKKQEILDQL
jgi:curli biogenesis system outer membrane secretion channel CsgG